MRPRGSDSYQRIYAVVARIPKGRVASYGQVAALAGLPRQARLVGYALNVLPADSDLPWHRVVNAEGRISLRADNPMRDPGRVPRPPRWAPTAKPSTPHAHLGHDQLQAQLLRREGVRFVDGAIPLARFGWRPRA
jgi:methylated-DNA-protein-cysteine methyltransferase-like protein